MQKHECIAEYTTCEHIEAIISSFDGCCTWPFEKGRMFFAYDRSVGVWVACDNTTGDCYVYDFETMFDCLHYLYGDIDSEGYPNK